MGDDPKTVSRQDAKTRRSFWVVACRLALLATLRENFFEKRAGNAVLKAFWPLERLSAALVRAAGRCGSCFGSENPLFSLKIGKFDRKSTQMAPDGPRQPPTAFRQPPRFIVDLPGASFSANVLPPAEGLCAFDPRCSFQRAEIIDYRTDPFSEKRLELITMVLFKHGIPAYATMEDFSDSPQLLVTDRPDRKKAWETYVRMYLEARDDRPPVAGQSPQSGGDPEP